MEKGTTVIAIFDDRSQAQRAIEQLKRSGFTETEIGVTARDGDSVGALWGLGILAGVLPAIGPAIAGGNLAALLSSAAAGAATAGLAGTLIGLGIPEEEADRYDEEFRSGRTLVTVHAMGRESEARAILQQCGGCSLGTERDATARTRRTAVASQTMTAPRARTIEAREDEEQVDALLRKESIEVDKPGRSDSPR